MKVVNLLDLNTNFASKFQCITITFTKKTLEFSKLIIAIFIK